MTSLPDPVPGLVISYSYLWSREADAGEETGRKDRPCSVLIAVHRRPEELVVYVAPITHSRPAVKEGGLEIPPGVKRRLGLDEAPSWVITTEFNAFPWPGPDVAASATNEEAASYYYGSFPKAFADKIILQFRNNLARNNVRAVKRPD